MTTIPTKPSVTPTGPFVNPPSRTADLAEAWPFLDIGVNRIMTKLEESLTFPNYSALYTVVYDYCTSNKMMNEEDKSLCSDSSCMYAFRWSCSLIRQRARILWDPDLYTKLTEDFTEHFGPMKEKADTLDNKELLRYYTTEWDRYTTGANYLNRLFTYLNRYWVKRERDEGKKEVLPGVHGGSGPPPRVTSDIRSLRYVSFRFVLQLALAQWKTRFFVPIQANRKKLVDVLLRLIERQRNGEAIDQNLMKKVVFSFISLGLDTTNSRKPAVSNTRTSYSACLQFDLFKERMSQTHDDMDINFSIMVLGTNFWLLKPPPHVGIELGACPRTTTPRILPPPCETIQQARDQREKETESPRRIDKTFRGYTRETLQDPQTDIPPPHQDVFARSMGIGIV
ncbi:ubiquitin ligase (cullin) of SCF [Marasmius crinis-equi]|uniref:Ubiquitin ligase (Cullin) of SCF n=1 Tax=Marasmius crinis-equi TaxID=585013 RepID=A0ABR3FS81_9AGAR